MERSIRVEWSELFGVCVLDFTWPGVINEFSVVHISASEAGQRRQVLPPRNRPHLAINYDRFVGNAIIRVANISPRRNAVRFILIVEWEDPLNIITDITVFDPPETIVEDFA